MNSKTNDWRPTQVQILEVKSEEWVTPYKDIPPTTLGRRSVSGNPG